MKRKSEIAQINSYLSLAEDSSTMKNSFSGRQEIFNGCSEIIEFPYNCIQKNQLIPIDK